MAMCFLLVFISGFAGLVYEVLWMKQLGLLLGNTSHAAALTLAAFFGGLAAGSWLWGRRTATMKNSLRAYAWLQIGIAVTAALYFGIMGLYYAIYPVLYQSIGSDWLLLGVKFVLALVLVFPPALFMGGTIPVIGQYVIKKRANFGKTAALLYGTNTLGAASGAFMAGFYLPLWLGFRATCMGAMTLNVLVAVIAFWLSRARRSQTDSVADVETRESDEPVAAENAGIEDQKPQLGRWAVLLVCFLSGFGFLALEVLWTRMFAQVLENSVYTFAAILVIVLFCLAVGALISARLAAMTSAPFHMLAVLIMISGIAVAVTPFIFMQVTNSLQILAMRGSWPSYILMIFKKGFITIGPPALLLGIVFPFLMKTEEKFMLSAGKSLGRLTAVNTTGAILGSLVCGFILLETLGMWGTMRIIAVAYLVTAVALPLGWDIKGVAVKFAGAILLLLMFTALDPTGLPITSVDPQRHMDEEVIETWEGSDGTVEVVRNQLGLAIKVNSHYGLGSTGALRQEKLQADIPLMIYPRTESIFFLGMGTGITAGSALDPQFEHVEKVVTCELIPEVITAAKKYITDVNGHDFTNGLFEDPRATVLAEDGRHYMMATEEKFDMVNGDLFVPFRSGVGSLYTKDHFQNVKERLKPTGVFFQWIPLYQVTENEFSVMARTMLEVFDHVSLWRTNFQPGHEVVALAGHKGGAPLPGSDIDSSAAKRQAVAGKSFRDLGRLALPFNSQTILFFYSGNVSAAADLFDDYPVNTDNRPVIEYMAPRTYRSKSDTSVPWFVGPRLARLVEEILARCPPDKDPLLVNRTAENRRLPLAGAAYYRARLWQVIGDPEKGREAWNRFLNEWLAEDEQ